MYFTLNLSESYFHNNRQVRLYYHTGTVQPCIHCHNGRWAYCSVNNALHMLHNSNGLIECTYSAVFEGVMSCSRMKIRENDGLSHPTHWIEPFKAHWRSLPTKRRNINEMNRQIKQFNLEMKWKCHVFHIIPFHFYKRLEAISLLIKWQISGVEIVVIIWNFENVLGALNEN